MSWLPLPAKMFFDDFSDDVKEYILENENIVSGKLRGLENEDESGKYIGFLVEDKPNISVGTVIRFENQSKLFKVTKVLYDSFNGNDELLKAYF